MRHGLLVLGVITASFGAACTVGRDLTYVPPTQQAASGPDGGAGPGSGSSGDESSVGTSMQTDVGDASAEGGGSDAALTKTCPPGSPAEVEPDDSSAQANVLEKGTTCGGLIVGGDNDWFKLVVAQKGTFSLAFRADADAVLGFLDQESDAAGTLTNGRSIVVNAAAGHHVYVHIFSANTTQPSAQSYSITLDNP